MNKPPHSLCEILGIIFLLTGQPLCAIICLAVMTFGIVIMFLYDWIRYKFDYPEIDEFRNAIRVARGLRPITRESTINHRNKLMKIF